MTTHLAFLAVALLSLSAHAALPADTTDARKIMEAVEGRAKGDRSSGRMTMTLSDRRGGTRVRVVETRSKLFDGGTKQLMVFQKPADVSGTGLLSIDYDAGDKDDDQWLYLPSLHKSTRISSGDKSGSFMGTDFTYADMTQADPADYDYRLVKPSVDLDGEICWLIEARGRSEATRKETGYVKSRLWISKAKLVPIRAKLWVKAGKRIKYLRFDRYEQISGVWVARQLSAWTKRGPERTSKTVLDLTTFRFDDETVTDDLFSQRQLEKGL